MVYCSAFTGGITVGARFNGCRDCGVARGTALVISHRFGKLLNSIGLTIVRTWARLGH